jgi:hypothetical protein
MIQKDKYGNPKTINVFRKVKHRPFPKSTKAWLRLGFNDKYKNDDILERLYDYFKETSKPLEGEELRLLNESYSKRLSKTPTRL